MSTKNMGRSGDWFPDVKGGLGVNATGAPITRGTVLMCDVAQTVATVPGYGPLGPFAQLILPVTAGLNAGLFAVALHDAPVGAPVRIMYRGVDLIWVAAAVLDGVSAYDVLSAQNASGVLNARPATGAAAGIGILLDNFASAVDALALCAFNGEAFIGPQTT